MRNNLRNSHSKKVETVISNIYKLLENKSEKKAFMYINSLLEDDNNTNSQNKQNVNFNVQKFATDFKVVSDIIEKFKNAYPDTPLKEDLNNFINGVKTFTEKIQNYQNNNQNAENQNTQNNQNNNQNAENQNTQNNQKSEQQPKQ
jgi:hypothetical protein